MMCRRESKSSKSLRQCTKRKAKTKTKTFSTRDSRVIPALSTKRARGDLTAQFEMGWGICRPDMAECENSWMFRSY